MVWLWLKELSFGYFSEAVLFPNKPLVGATHTRAAATRFCWASDPVKHEPLLIQALSDYCL